MKNKSPEVLIVMGSDSDLLVMKEAGELLDTFSISYEMTIVSAHRTPKRLFEYGKNAHRKGFKVIIAGAGGAAHLPGMMASFSPLPVIGVPIKTSTLSGVDSLYSIVQMPKGVPVACTAINGALNAGLIAAKIILSSDAKSMSKLIAYQKSLENEVLKKAKKLSKVGYKKYLKG